MKQWVCGLLKGERLKSTEKISKCKLLCARRHFVHTHTKKNKTLHHMTRPGSILEGFRYTYPTRVRIWVISTITAPNKHISCKSCSSRTRPSVTATMIGRVCKFVCEKIKCYACVRVSYETCTTAKTFKCFDEPNCLSLLLEREISRETKERKNDSAFNNHTEHILWELCEQSCERHATENTPITQQQSNTQASHKQKTRHARSEETYSHTTLCMNKRHRTKTCQARTVCVCTWAVFTQAIYFACRAEHTPRESGFGTDR